MVAGRGGACVGSVVSELGKTRRRKRLGLLGCPELGNAKALRSGGEEGQAGAGLV